jgi:hypothetical protein
MLRATGNQVARLRGRNRPASEVTAQTLAMVASMRRPIYLCPLTMAHFQEHAVASIGQWAEARGYDLAKVDFVAILRRNRRYLVDYVVYGLLLNGEVIASAKDWPEHCLLYKPSLDEQMALAKGENARFGKPDKWCRDTTAVRMVEFGYAEFKEDGLLHWGKVKLGIRNDDKAKVDWIYPAMIGYLGASKAPYILENRLTPDIKPCLGSDPRQATLDRKAATARS